MKRYNIEKLSKKDIFSGRIIAPMKQWLTLHGIETKKYDYNADMAIITHYLQNKDYPEGDLYREEALLLMERYYRATHTALGDEDNIEHNQLEGLFAEIFDTPVYRRHQGNNAFTFVDLFAGIGGFRIALEQLGGRCVYASEFDATAQRSYGMNHGVIPFGDIKLQENKDRIPEDVDVLCAGFPCQPFSLAGLRRGFSDETKGTLFYDLQEIIAAKHPRIILLENVPGLLSIHNRDEKGNRLQEKTIDTILHILKDELNYYIPKPEILNAKNFGVPQNRDRVFIVGFLEDQGEEYQYPTGGLPEVRFGDIREREIVDTRYYMSERYWQTLLRHKQTQHDQGRGYGYRTIKDEDFGHTLMVGGMGLERNLVEDFANPYVNQVEDPRGELNHDHIRVLTERECARMQGFPDYFEIYVGKSPAYKQFGNSVAIPVVKAVAQSLLEYGNIGYNPVE
ncbi:MAG: DNA (cytosine-5-)-methyltransferase [Bacteroidales bacterium]|nr:DNA (cytosine-5-)-methyltransferase [Bacteroidales bacterium]